MNTSVKVESVRWLAELGRDDVGSVGGKNASLGEMIRSLEAERVRVPDGFATTAEAYWRFLDDNALRDRIGEWLGELRDRRASLAETGRRIRDAIVRAEFPDATTRAISEAYAELSRNYGVEAVDVAVRSSATAEDMPDASFAGQQETFLNISGVRELLDACRKCYASLFTDRAISYREAKGFDHLKIALSVGVQKMVRSDKAGAGVMFSIDTETGFPNVVVINAAWGLGENVVKGAVNPDAYVVFKPLLEQRDVVPIIERTIGEKQQKMVYARGSRGTTRNIETTKRERRSAVLDDDEIVRLARWACVIEKHYGRPMDIEWAKDGDTGDLFIVQARPETVHSQKLAGALKTYRLKHDGRRLLAGLSIGQAIAAGTVRRIDSPAEIDRFREGDVLVTEMTDPDWVPIMKKAAGIVTDTGGRTCHAAIVSRELGVPAIVGTGHATETLQDGDEVTLSCAEGDEGHVYEGRLDYEEQEVNLEDVPRPRTQIMMNIASPAASFRWWRLPCDGIGLARLEFIISNIIKVHPMALVRFDELKDEEARKQIQELTRDYEDRTEYFVEHLARGIAKIAAPRFPGPVIVRLSDFKTNEYANLIGGRQFEEQEANPMLGFRGASRYYHERYRDGFALECRALKRVRQRLGFTNVIVMVPFCRTPAEADRVLEAMAQHGLKRGVDGLEVYVMCEIPSNVVLAEKFSERFDGFSIGSNDLTQLVLGIDRDSAVLAELFDERNEAVTTMIQDVIRRAHRAGRKVGICGQAPSDYPEFAQFLVQEGIDSISLNPDTLLPTRVAIFEKEQALAASRAGRGDEDKT